MDTRRAVIAVLLSAGAIATVYLVRERPIDEARLRPPVGGATMPYPTDSPSKGRDIGLPFSVCRVTRVEGLGLGGERSGSTAWTAAKVRPDGSCDRSLNNSYFVVVDVDNDGLADASSRPLRFCVFCRPVAATDMDGDGDGELLVLEQGGSVSSYAFYEIEGTRDSWELQTIPVADPGHRRAGHPPGKPLRFWVGGDEGFSGAAFCTGYPADPLLILEWSNHPIEGPGSGTTDVHRTSFRLRDGAFHVVETSDTQVPTDSPRSSGLRQSRDVCGVDLSRPG